MSLTPYGAHVLLGGLPMTALSDRVVSLEELLGRDALMLSEELESRLAGGAPFDFLDSFLGSRCRDKRGGPHFRPKLDLLDLVVRDMEATLAFYRALGVDIPEEAVWRTATGAHHVDLDMPGGSSLHFDSAALAAKYNRGWSEPSGTGTRIVVGFRLASRDEVDRLHEKLGPRLPEFAAVV